MLRDDMKAIASCVVSLFLFVSCSSGSSRSELAAFAGEMGAPQDECCGQSVNLIHVEIDPAPRSGFIKQYALNVDISTDSIGDFSLKPTVNFNGRIQNNPFAESKSPCLANVTGPDKPDVLRDIIALPAVQQDQNPSVEDAIIGQKDASLAIPEGDNEFRLELIAGQKYVLIINSKGLCGLAPIFIFLEKSDIDFDEDIAPVQKTVTISGQINSAANFSGKADVRIYQGSHLVSSVGSVDSSGVFRVELAQPLFDPQSTYPLLLRIEPKEEARYLPLLSKQIAVESAKEGISDESFDIDTSGATQEVGFSITDNTSEPVKDARVLIKGRLDGYKVFLETKTDAWGKASLSILEGDYEVAILPLGNERQAMSYDRSFRVRSSNRSFSAVLKKRDLLKASLTDPSGDPVFGAHIQITRIGEIGLTRQSGPLLEVSTQLRARTLPSGELCSEGIESECSPLYLDEGRYELFISPPDGSHLSRHKTTVDFPLENNLQIALPPSRSISGRILGPKGQGIAKTVVRLFSADKKNLIEEQSLIGQAYTDAEGYFQAFIPGE